ncbi:MAG: hypothetical protein ABI134_08350 [Byssovorax sp.]
MSDASVAKVVSFDEQGWVMGMLEPLPIDGSWTLLAPEAESRVDAARWTHQAETFFRATLRVVQEKRYPAGTLPIVDAVEVEIAPRGAETTTRVLVVTLPIDRVMAAKRAGDAGARAIGGAGMDLLVGKAKHVWQIAGTVEDGGNALAPLALAGVLASLLLAPIVPPGAGTIFGVKGARERLSAAGWKN